MINSIGIANPDTNGINQVKDVKYEMSKIKAIVAVNICIPWKSGYALPHPI